MAMEVSEPRTTHHSTRCSTSLRDERVAVVNGKEREMDESVSVCCCGRVCLYSADGSCVGNSCEATAVATGTCTGVLCNVQ